MGSEILPHIFCIYTFGIVHVFTLKARKPGQPAYYINSTSHIKKFSAKKYRFKLFMSNFKHHYKHKILSGLVVYALYVLCREHCLVEYDGETVMFYPKANLCTIDGVAITEPTRLPQGTHVY